MKSEIRAICKELVQKEAKKRIANYLAGPEFKATWDSYGRPTIAEEVEKVIIANSGAVLAQMIGGISSEMLRDFANRMRQQSW